MTFQPVPYIRALQIERTTFDTEPRNLSEEDQKYFDGFLKAALKKTGTTIVGAKCKDGIVLGSDTRATMGTVVADKTCQKLHNLTDNLWLAGSGGAADLDHTAARLKSDLELFRASTKRLPRMQTLLARLVPLLFKYQGAIHIGVIMGGVDPAGVHLWQATPEGSCLTNDYLTLGSGSLFAKSVLATQYRDDMTIDECAEMVANAVEAGVMNDLASGNQIDIVKIRIEAPNSPELIRPYRMVSKPPKPPAQKFPLGTTVIISEKRFPISKPSTMQEEEIVA